MTEIKENPFKLSDEEVLQKASEIKHIIQSLTYAETMKVFAITLTLTFGYSVPKEGES